MTELYSVKKKALIHIISSVFLLLAENPDFHLLDPFGVNSQYGKLKLIKVDFCTVLWETGINFE